MDSTGVHKSDRWQQNGPHTFLAAFTGNNQGNPQNNNRMVAPLPESPVFAARFGKSQRKLSRRSTFG